MSALAIVLKQLKNNVRGSDYDVKIFTQEDIQKNNIEVLNFSIDNLKDIDLMVVGHNFIDSDNIELEYAKNNGIRVLEYNECINEIIKDYYSIGVCGSNGKSTTTALIKSILDEVENTSYLIGSGEGRGNKKSKYFTFEACEYKEHFLKYFPNIILVTNIDYDHVDYYRNEESYILAFYKFMKHSQDIVICNGDDKNLEDIPNTFTFGLNKKNTVYASNIDCNNGISYDLYYKGKYIDRVKLNLYGMYMVYDTLSSIAVGLYLNIDFKIIMKGLNNFNGVKRRFKETIVNGDVYIDDYAHHPSKINAIIEAIRCKYKDRKIIAFYRPDRVSRLDYFSLEIAKSLLKANYAYILPFKNQNEEEKKSIEAFVKKHKNIKLVNEEIYKKVSKLNDVVYLMMSSKDISEVKDKILEYKKVI